MKNILIALGVILSLASCQHKSPARDAEERFQQEMKQMEQDRMSHEKYIDSLVNVASGLEGTTLRANRQHALDILKKEYPEIDWTSMQRAIDNYEIYSEE